MPDLVGSEVGVPEDQVAWFLLAGLDAGAVTGGKPGALRRGGAGILTPIWAWPAWVKLEQSQVVGPAAPIR